MKFAGNIYLYVAVVIKIIFEPLLFGYLFRNTAKRKRCEAPVV